MSAVVSILEGKETIAIIIAVVGGSFGGIFALWRWTVDQRWRRVQYSYQMIQQFMTKPNTIKALQMLDSKRRIELLPGKTIKVDRNLIVRALVVKESYDNTRFADEEFEVRNIFDEFFTDLSTFQHHIDAKLIKLRDIRPYLKYWIMCISTGGKVHGNELGSQIKKFLDSFEYTAVMQLSHSMGYSFVEYGQTDE